MSPVLCVIAVLIQKLFFESGCVAGLAAWMRGRRVRHGRGGHGLASSPARAACILTGTTEDCTGSISRPARNTRRPRSQIPLPRHGAKMQPRSIALG